MAESTVRRASRPAAAVPGPAGSRLRLLRGLATHPPRLLTALRDEYGPVVRLRLGPMTVYVASDPADVQDVLVTSSRAFGNDILRSGTGEGGKEPPLARLLGRGLLTSDGELHKRQRRLMQPLFHRQRIAEYADAFVELSERQAAGYTDGARVDMHTEMVELTLAVVTRTIFDVALDGRVAATVRTALPRNDGPLRFSALPAGQLLARLPLPSNVRFARGKAALDAVVTQLVTERRAAGATGSDLLSMLVAAQDADTGELMDDVQVRDEVLTILMAGHDTTANALAWAFHLLGENPRARLEMQRELDEVLAGRAPTAADLPRLAWTDAVLSEAMRIYPPVWTVGRRPLADHVIGGYDIPANSMVLMSPWVVHRDPRWWPQPERFAPQRWVTAMPGGDTDELTGTALDPSRPRFAYFPFGGGPRQCIGNVFARMEGVLALATISRRWSFDPVPGSAVRAQAKIIVRPRPGLPMTVSRRPV